MQVPVSVPLFSASAASEGVDLGPVLIRVLESHSYILGDEVTLFEQEFARYTGTRHCTSVANGTDALELALRAVGVVAGDTVFCVANAGFYSTAAIQVVGSSPAYVDIDEQTLTMCPVALKEMLAAARPAAVIVTHLYGQLAAIEQIAGLCRAAGIPLIEDCAQAHGARRKGKQAGSFGDIACFSFYPTKNLGALGDAGALLSDSEALDARVRMLRQYGWSRKYEVVAPHGRNSRMDEIQAAVLREKLPFLDRQNARRQNIAAGYSKAFESLPMRLPSGVGEEFVAHLYVVRCKHRDELRKHLLARGVSSEVHYPFADVDQPVLAGGYPADALPNTLAACREVVSLPCFPGMTTPQREMVVEAVQSFFRDVEN